MNEWHQRKVTKVQQEMNSNEETRMITRQMLVGKESEA